MYRGLLLSLIVFYSFSVSAGDEPEIVGQKPLTTQQGQSITISLNDLTVINEDGDPYPNYPAGFSLRISEGDNYEEDGNTVTPDGDFVGTLIVRVRVVKGNEKSDRYDLRIEVTPRQQNNVPPVIIGQVSLSTKQDKAITLRLADLFVNDPDDSYPNGFSLKIQTGTNYSVNGSSIQPASGFTGILAVPVVVNDGEADSPPFTVSITVEPKANNAPPVITGQSGISTIKNQPIAIALRNLTVTDPDNRYPDDFTLNVLPGENYTASGTTVTPAPEYTGNLVVNVNVSDGTNTSNTYGLRVSVVDNAQLEIVGQTDLEVNEDTTLELKLADIKVNDPSKKYPSGFQLTVLSGKNYTADGARITPAPNFSGTLEVPVRVTNGSKESQPFNVLVRVIPVNDIPVISGLPEVPVLHQAGSGPVAIASNLVIEDPDDEVMNMAEVGFETGFFQPNGDVLVPSYNTSLIRVVFDPVAGTLFMIGEAPVSEYAQVLRSITYEFNPSDSLQPQREKKIYFTVNDGSAMSERKPLVIQFEEDIDLDIPTVFTPNDDDANDTWRVRMRKGSDNTKLTVRVFSKSGVLVYEASTLEDEWDGRMGGRMLPSDNYLYHIELSGPVSRKSYEGFVTILH